MKLPKIDPRNVLLALSFASLLGISGFFVYTEVSKIQRAWSEIMFAKEHPNLVRSTREMYEDGLTTVEKWVVEKNIQVVSPTVEAPSK